MIELASAFPVILTAIVLEEALTFLTVEPIVTGDFVKLLTVKSVEGNVTLSVPAMLSLSKLVAPTNVILPVPTVTTILFKPLLAEE